ncbi:MAG: hypothetical protein AMS24_02015 [Chlamydiae bacterium SM23_39]|nr:MAG: hypothetical protein AMS24_02015 [Chlamydiae bacterium SM23_39]
MTHLSKEINWEKEYTNINLEDKKERKINCCVRISVLSCAILVLVGFLLSASFLIILSVKPSWTKKIFDLTKSTISAYAIKISNTAVSMLNKFITQWKYIFNK